MMTTWMDGKKCVPFTYHLDDEQTGWCCCWTIHQAMRSAAAAVAAAAAAAAAAMAAAWSARAFQRRMKMKRSESASTKEREEERKRRLMTVTDGVGGLMTTAGRGVLIIKTKKNAMAMGTRQGRPARRLSLLAQDRASALRVFDEACHPTNGRAW
ncbi:hypothetical protein EV126DRAFT_227687 [Verticillium dahliae]|nr:hypothetical protein EV126DRAFT_227687 [Verticillium dahliae]